jgi:hypothetical protein
MRHLRALAALLPALVLISCSEHITDDSRNNWYDANDAASFHIVRTTTISATDTTVQDMADGYFSDFDSTGLYGGDLRVNGTVLPTRRDGDYLSYHLQSDSIRPLFLDAPVYRLSTAGGGIFPSIVDSITAPPPIVVTAPAPSDTVHLSRGLTITWDPQPGSSTSLRLMLFGIDDASRVTLPETFENLPDIGSYTITPAMLPSFSRGQLVIELSRLRVLKRPLAGNRHYRIRATSAVTLVMRAAQ